MGELQSDLLADSEALLEALEEDGEEVREFSRSNPQAASFLAHWGELVGGWCQRSCEGVANGLRRAGIDVGPVIELQERASALVRVSADLAAAVARKNTPQSRWKSDL